MGQLERGSSKSEKVVKKKDPEKLIRNACFPYVALRVSASLKEGPISSLIDPSCKSSSAMSTVVLVSGVVAFGGAPSLAAASAGAALLPSLVLEQA